MTETYTETDMTVRIGEMLDAAGLADPITPAQLAPIDQFHAGGTAAVDRLVATLGLTSESRVLDVGSGLGGPARHIAVTTGATVRGIDITSAFIDAANDLTRRCAMTGEVGFDHVDVAELHVRQPFHAAITMHVQMSVQDKTAWYGQIGRALTADGRLAVWEVCQAPGAAPVFPMPWSKTGSDSHLVTPDELREQIERAGFVTDEWADETSWVAEVFASRPLAGPPAGLSLAGLLDGGPARTSGFAGGIATGTVEVWRGSFTRARI